MEDPRINLNTQKVTIRFRFPTASAGATGPTAFASPGLAYKQFIGVTFPADVAKDLALDALVNNAPKFTCELSDGTNTYTMLAVAPATAENNIAYCRLDDVSANTPLKATVNNVTVTYRLSVTLTTKITTNYVRSVGIFTSTSATADKMIIDAIPAIGTMGIYGDFTTATPKGLEVTNTALTVTSEPSATAASQVVYPYNNFEVNLTIKANTVISAADHLIVFKYPKDVISLTAPTITSTLNTANNALEVALKGTLTLKAFGDNGFYIDGITEDLVPNRVFKLNIKGWKALNKISAARNLEVIVYYKNTYSVLSYVTNALTSITRDTLTVTANHPDLWDVYRGGAFPIVFTVKGTTELTEGGWVLIRHSNLVDQTGTAGNKVTFVPSTCDLSENDSSLIDNGFGKRSSCYPLRTLDNTYTNTAPATNGSGFFFFVKGPPLLKDYY